MKKILFATTAAAALAVAGTAQAKVELGLGGYWEEWIGFVDQDDNNARDWDQKSDKEIHIKGSATLDNGITFGVRAELEMQDIDGGNKHDEAVLSVSGGFGTLLLGNEDNVGQLLHVGAPDVGVGLTDGDMVTGWWVNVNGVNNAMTTTLLYDNDDTNKVSYISPNFSGFVAGVTLTPNLFGAQGGFGGGMPTEANDSAYTVAAQYANEFDGVSIKGVVAHGTADDADWDQTKFGAQVGFGGFVVGGSYADYDGAARGAGQGDAYDLAVSYGEGPWAASIGFWNSESDINSSERQVVQASFKYNLGPGVDWKNSIASVDFTDAAGADNEGWAAVTGFALAF